MCSQKKIGVSFILPNEYGTSLATIFKYIPVHEYCWNFTGGETLFFNEKENKLYDDFFKIKLYTGNEFQSIINQGNYYIIHARILASTCNEDYGKDNISTYNDFLNSKYEIILLCSDCFVDLYAKDEELINKIAINCKETFQSTVDFITITNNPRTSLKYF